MPLDVTTNICCTIPVKPHAAEQFAALLASQSKFPQCMSAPLITGRCQRSGPVPRNGQGKPVVIPRFMGPPGSDRNIAKQQHEGEDILRAHSKRFINVAIPAHLEAGANGGRTVSDRSSKSISQTVMGFYSEQAAHASPNERLLNTRAPKPF